MYIISSLRKIFLAIELLDLFFFLLVKMKIHVVLQHLRE